tara:strand:- start:34 stop:540 length:507 start_codon:yes stop_codon:yes gene_type:complete
MHILKKFFLISLFFFLSTSISNSSEKIAFIDIDYILNNSNLGKLILQELENVNNENFKNLTQKEKIIKKKKEDINKTKNISSKEKLEKDIIEFNKEVEKFRLEKDKILKDFKLLKESKLDNFLKSINPLIQDYMKKNSIEIVLEKKQIFIGSSSLEITNDIIKLIDKN